MATDVILTLNELRCIRESDRGGDGSEPYIWPALIWVDDDTLATAALVGSAIGTLDDAQRIVRDSMRAGQTARIPNGTLRFRRDESKTLRALFGLIVMWEQDDMPKRVVRAAFAVFKRELPAAIARRLLDLQGADAEGRRVIGDEIAIEMQTRIRTAIENELTLSEKAQIAIGTLDVDDFVASSTRFFDGTSVPVEFGLERGTDHYVVAGRLDVRPVVVERCRRQAQAVITARATVNSIEAQIVALQDELHGRTPDGSTPRPKPEVNRDIASARDDLDQATRALAEAQAALRGCRRRPPVLSPTESVVVA